MNQSDLPAPPRRSIDRAGGPTSVGPLEQAMLALENGDATAAIRIARKALAGKRNDLPALELLARAHWLAEDYAQVLQTTRRLLALNPNEHGYRILQAMALRGLGQFALAVATLRRCLSETTDAGARVKVIGLLEELDAIQCGAIRKHRHADPTFRRAYDRDPEAACRSLGFELTWYEDVQILFDGDARRALGPDRA